MKKTILKIVLCAFFLTNCANNNEQRFYTWKTTIEVKYSDNTKETIHNTIELHRKFQPYFEIVTKSEGLFSDTKLVPCLTVSEASYYKGENLACDIRSFKVLSQIKHYEVIQKHTR